MAQKLLLSSTGGVFSDVLFIECANLGVDLYEMDKGSDEYYERIKGVIDGVLEIKELDILKGIPDLNLATKLFDGIIKTFGKNPDDQVTRKENKIDLFFESCGESNLILYSVDYLKLLILLNSMCPNRGRYIEIYRI